MVLLANVKRKRAKYVVLYIHHDWFSGSILKVQKMIYFQGARKQSAHHICLKYELNYLFGDQQACNSKAWNYGYNLYN